MKKYATKEYAAALFEITRDLKGANLTEALQVFAQMLADHQQLKKADRIISEYISFAKEQYGIVEVRITTARPLTVELRGKLQKSFGEKTEMVEFVDEKILGGMMLRDKNTILDATLRTQIKLLGEKMLTH